MNDDTDQTPAPEQIEAEIADTREHLTEAVEELAAKLDVKAQAQDKIAEVKDQAQHKMDQVKEKLEHAKEQTQEKLGQVKDQVQDRVGRGPEVSTDQPAGRPTFVTDAREPGAFSAGASQARRSELTELPSGLLDRFRRASRPVQAVVVGVPLAVIVLLIVRGARR